MGREDILYVDAAFDRYATQPSEGIMKASEHFLTNPKFEGLKVDPKGYIIHDTRKTQNFKELKAALLGPVDKGKEYASMYLDD